MILDRVTVTGADDSVKPSDLISLTKQFPFVEWGILLSRSQEGTPRFPSLDWMLGLLELQGQFPMKLSGHLCGAWVRALCRGSDRFEAERPGVSRMFQRVQLNFHGDPHDAPEDSLVAALKDWGRAEYVLQFDDVNNLLLGALWHGGIHAVPLFDTSGGAGVEPGEWPTPVGPYCGYAGGLHPDKLEAQLQRIALAAGTSRVWVDVETHVRSPSRFNIPDRQFDLDKVEKFLAAAEPWVNATAPLPGSI